MNGHAPGSNGYSDTAALRHAQDAEEFELHGLESDDDDEAGDDAPLVHKEAQRSAT